MTIAAISCLDDGLQCHKNPMNNENIRRLVTSLVKSATKRPAKRTEIMPVKPFMDYFQSLKDNEQLTLKQLRLKAITLLALTIYDQTV